MKLLLEPFKSILSAAVKKNPRHYQTLLMALALLFSVKAAPAAEPAGAVVLNFPANRVVGSVLLFDDNDKGQMSATHRQKFAVAKGRVVVPANREFLLRFIDDLPDKTWTNSLASAPVHFLDLQSLPLKDGDLSFLKNFRQVRHLEIDRTDISDGGVKVVSELLPGLTFLGASRTLCTSKCFRYLTKLKKLSNLQLGFNTLGREGFSDLGGCTELRVLRLDSCQLTDNDIDTIARLEKLKTVKLTSNSGITDRGLIKLLPAKSLTGINLVGTRVTMNGLRCLKSLNHLKRLEVHFEPVDSEAFSRMQKFFRPAKLKDVFNGRDLPLEIFDPLH